MRNPSQFHPNKSVKNYLIYNMSDYFFKKFENFYKGTLVDLGCGEAPYKEYFLQFVDRYIGVDWSSSYHNLKADVISNLNEKIDLDDEIADTAIAISVLEHLYDPHKFLKETYRILKNGGYFIIQVPFMWWVHEAPYDYFRYTPYGLKHLLTNANFSNIEIYPMGGFFTMWFLKLNYFIERSIRGRLLKLGLGSLVDTLTTHFYNFTQTLSPILDLLDNNKELDTFGYFVVCRKVVKVL